MKNRKLYVGTTGILCIAFCLFLPFYFGLQFLLPILMPEESSSEVSEDLLTPDECSPLEAWQLCDDALKAIGNYSSQTEGYIDTQVLFFNYRQQINNKRVVTDESVFLQSMNTGTLLNVGLQQYFDGSKAYLRPCQLVSSNHLSWADSPVGVSMGAYYDAFGPVTDSLSCFLLNDRTLVTGFYLYESEGVYSFSFELSAEAALYYARTLRTLCQLESDPAFRSVEITLDMDANFRPLRMSVEEEYTISMDLIGETVCKAKYTEVFNYEDISLSEKAFFEGFSSLEESNTIPKLSTGYNFLFSLFGNSNTYDASLQVSGETIPLKISTDINDKSIVAAGEAFSFVYCNGYYYFDGRNNKICSAADAFNNKMQPFAEPGNSSGLGVTRNTPAPAASIADGLNIKNENGKLTVSSTSDDLTFTVTLNTSSMAIEALSIDFSLMGSKGSLQMVQSEHRHEKPSLLGYTDVTDALDSLDILFDLADQPNTYYHLRSFGETPFEANLTLTLGDSISVSASSLDKDFPIDIFWKNDVLSTVINDLSIIGGLSDFESLLSHFQESGSNTPSDSDIDSGVATSGIRIVPEGKWLTVYFGNGSDEKITFFGTYCTYEDQSTSLQITKIGHGEQPAAEAPSTKHSVSAAELSAFLEGSVYPELLHAGTIYADLDVRIPEGRFDVNALISTSPQTVIRMNTTVYGEPLEFFYKDDDLYICHEVFNAFVAADKFNEVFSDTQSSGDSSRNTPSSSAEGGELKSIEVENHQIKLVFEEYTLFLTKESFRLVGKGTSIRSTDLRGEKHSATIDVPQKKDCIDLAELAQKLSYLENQKRFAFTGTYSDDMIAAMIKRLDLYLSEDGDISQLAAEAVIGNTISQLVKVYYNQESVYLDIGGIKLFAAIDGLLAQPGTTTGGSSAAGGSTNELFSALSTLKSITYSNETLTVVTDDVNFSISWSGKEVDIIRYNAESSQLLLVSCDPRPIEMPDKMDYTDITAFGSLLKALYNTIGAESFRFGGNIDVKLFSYTLENVVASGTVSAKNGALNADLTFTVPYIPGISSEDIPLVYHQKLLQDCSIVNRVIVYDGKIYICKEIQSEYGESDPETMRLINKRYVTLEEFQKDPTATLVFLFNLEKELAKEEFPDPEPDDTESDPIFSETPFDSVSRNDEYYVLELSPNILPDPSDALSFLLYTDDRFVTKLEAIANISVFTIRASLEISDHGEAEIAPPEKENLETYLPLQK